MLYRRDNVARPPCTDACSAAPGVQQLPAAGAAAADADAREAEKGQSREQTQLAGEHGNSSEGHGVEFVLQTWACVKLHRVELTSGGLPVWRHVAQPQLDTAK